PAILGVSFGGVLALEFAARQPHRLSRLIVQGAGARFEPSLLQQGAALILDRYPLPADNPFVNQFFNLLFGGPQRPGPLVDFVVRRCWQTDQSVMAHRFPLVEQFDLGPRLHRISAPALILTGDRDLLVSPGNLRTLLEGMPQAESVKLANCGHLAFVTH